MIHVWIEPHPCGPFAALEGVAAGTIAEGEAAPLRPRARLRSGPRPPSIHHGADTVRLR